MLKFIRFFFSSQPAFLHQYIFIKNNKTVILQEMVHISHEQTYAQINNDIKDFIYTEPEAKIYLEGIHGDARDCEKLNHKMASLFGLERIESEEIFIKQIYEALAIITGWQMQSRDNYLKDIEESKLIKADITYAQMYEGIKHIEEDKDKEKIKLYISPKLINFLKKIKIPGYFVRKVITGVIIDNKAEKKLSKSHGKFKELFQVILNKRNDHLINMIETNTDQHIFVTYGAAHAKGIKEELQKRGYTCKIKKQISFKV